VAILNKNNYSVNYISRNIEMKGYFFKIPKSLQILQDYFDISICCSNTLYILMSPLSERVLLYFWRIHLYFLPTPAANPEAKLFARAETVLKWEVG